MKHIFIFLLCITGYQAWAIKASVDVLRFSTIEHQYIEVNYRIFANSLHAEHDQFSTPKILSTIVIYNGDEIVDYQKNMLVGSENDMSDLIDVRRFVLQPGDYRVELELKEQLHDGSIFKIEKSLSIESNEKVEVSDIMLLATAKNSTEKSNMVKNGVYMEAQPYGFYPEDVDLLRAYVEVYNVSSLDPLGKYYMSYEIVKGYKDLPKQTEQIKYKRIEHQELQGLLLSMDISDLPSADYHIAISLYNQEKEVIASRKANFVRSNLKGDVTQLSRGSKRLENSFTKSIDKDSLNYYLMAIAPLIESPKKAILDNLVSKGESIAKQMFLHEYWTERAGESAEASCNAYMKIARAVDEMFFDGTSYGFDTDMGYIFLRYGNPDDALEVDNELSAPPYQIWRYNKIEATNENNVKFLFYAPSLSHNDYRLLHSTCRVELQNPAWEVELYRKLPDEHIGNPGEATKVNDGFTRRARDFWEDF